MKFLSGSTTYTHLSADCFLETLLYYYIHITHPYCSADFSQFTDMVFKIELPN